MLVILGYELQSTCYLKVTY
uniref:Uncharacterized protein n=1 Tax=Rhizophora mucronata TaxID=61149 RepID=A0A2P2IY84_RHIMU